MNARINRRTFGATLAAAAVSAKSWAQARPWRVAFANLSDELPFGAAVVSGFKTAVQDVRDMQFTFLDNRFDAAKAVENARTVVAANYDLFIEYNIQIAANAIISKLVEEAKLKTLAIQAPVGNAPLFAVNNYAAGVDSGRFLAEAAKAKWGAAEPVFPIIGLPEAGPLFLDRGNGAKEAITKVYPAATFVEYSSKNDVANSRQIATDILTRNPDRKVAFWVHADVIAIAVLAAVRNQNREADCLISTTGGDRVAFPEIRKAGSPLLGTYSFFPEAWASDVIPLARAMLRGESVPAKTTPRRQLFVHGRNIEEYYGK